MRKLILQEFVSVDGYAADSNGKTTFFESLNGNGGSEVDDDLLHFITTIDTILLGANTYRMFVEYWPTATIDQERVADALNQTPKVVFSSTLEEALWGKWEPARLVKTSASEEVKKLKQQPGKDLVIWGSVSLAQSLLADGLIDEIQLRVCPTALGRGLPLFAGVLPLQLMETKVYPSVGLVLARYAVP